jgi:integrase
MDLAPASWTNYESVVRRWLKPRLGSVPLRRLTNRQLEGVYREAQNSGLKKSSAKKIHVVASSALGDALRWDLIERNPAATARSPADTPQDTRIMTTDEIGRMLAHAASDPAWHTYLYVLLTSGARRGEVCALRWRDVDLDDQRITIRATAHDDGFLRETKTKKTRTFGLGDTTIGLLRQHLARGEAAGGPMTGERFVFSPRPGNTEFFKPHSMSKRIARMRSELGIEDLKLHGLRHSATSYLINGGTDRKTTADRGGWTRMTTLDRYTGSIDRNDRDAAALIDSIVAGTVTEDQ